MQLRNQKKVICVGLAWFLQVLRRVVCMPVWQTCTICTQLYDTHTHMYTHLQVFPHEYRRALADNMLCCAVLLCWGGLV